MIGPLRAAEMNFPYRRMTNPILVPVNADGTASSVAAPTGFFTGPSGHYTSFEVTNLNACAVRLQGFSDANGRVTSTTGWVFPPGAKAVYSTQYPVYLSAMLFDTPLYPLANAKTTTPLELTYGYGS